MTVIELPKGSLKPIFETMEQYEEYLDTFRKKSSEFERDENQQDVTKFDISYRDYLQDKQLEQ